MKLFFILGNQLFPLNYIEKFKKDHLFFLAEDYELCTYEKHHKQKILLFLSSMRSYLDRLRKDKFKTEYLDITNKSFKSSYTDKLKSIIKSKYLFLKILFSLNKFLNEEVILLFSINSSIHS